MSGQHSGCVEEEMPVDWESSLKEVIHTNLIVDGNDIDEDNYDDGTIMCSCNKFHEQNICHDSRCFNFASQIECTRCTKYCCNQRFQRKQYANLEVCDTLSKGFGLFALEKIPKDAFIREYVGEVISQSEHESRLQMRRYEGVSAHTFVMQLKPGNYVDASSKGNMSRFINHSCEPNCCIEKWIVKGKIRVGIFASTDIEIGEELSFDYQWAVSNRPLTKCFCGKPSCRGTLELLTSGQREFIHNLYRKGAWVLSDDITREDGSPIDAEWLIGKRVKVWWDGDQVYYEADVLAYEITDGKVFHTLHYIYDDKKLSEILIGSKTRWYYLDETKEEVVIKKKVRSADEMDIVPDASNVMDNNNQMADTTKSFTPSIIRTNKIRVKYEVKYDIVKVLLNREGYDGDKAVIWEILFNVLDAKYSIKAYFLNQTSVNYNLESQSVLLFGDRSEIGVLQKVLGDLESKFFQSSVKNKRELELKEIKMSQSVVLTNDWRVLPTRGTFDLKYILDEPKDLSVVPGLLSAKQLPRYVQGKRNNDVTFESDNVVYTVSEPTRRNLLNYVKGCARRLRLSETDTLVAINILLRALSMIDESSSSITDATSMVAACILLAIKLYGRFKPKNLKKIVKSAYCECFSRDDVDVASISDLYVQRALDRETAILQSLKYDIYSTDPNTFYFSDTCVRFIQDKFTRAELDSYAPSMKDSLDLAIAFAVTAPDTWVAIPTDLMYGAIFFTSHLLKFLVTGKHFTELNDILYDATYIPGLEFQLFYMNCCDLFKLSADSLKWACVFISSSLSKIPRGDVPWLAITDTLDHGYWEYLPNIIPELFDYFIRVSHKIPYVWDMVEQSSYKVSNKLYKEKRMHARIPWFNDASNDSGASIDTESIVAISRDLYLGSIPSTSLASLNASHIPNYSTDAMTISIKTWPSQKQLQKEAKRAERAEVNDIGFSASALQELGLFQHIHNKSITGQCKYVIAPYTILALNGSIKLPSVRSSKHDKDCESGQIDASENGSCSTSNLLQEILHGTSNGSMNSGRNLGYYMVFSPVVMTLQTYISANSTAAHSPFHSSFICDVFHDLISAINYCDNCGITFKWLNPEEIYIAPNGTLMLGGFSGANIANGSIVGVGASVDDATSSAKRRKLNDANVSKDQSRQNKDDSVFNSPCISTTAPEVILGGNSTYKSNIWCAVSICCLIISGKPIIPLVSTKSSNGDDKYVQYMYRTLGTPKLLGYDMKEFDSLPLASTYGRKIKAEDGSLTEGKNRVHKAVLKLVPGHILQKLSSCKIGSEAESDNGGLLDFFQKGLHLVPSKRSMSFDLLNINMFKESKPLNTSEKVDYIKAIIGQLQTATFNKNPDFAKTFINELIH